MKRLFAIAFAAALAGCATAPVAETPAGEAKSAGSEPVLPQLADPNPFANYGAGMASDKDHPMAYEWQSAHGAEIAEATKPETLGKFHASDEAARTLLDGIQDDYSTDPVVMIQIAAVTQLVMRRDGGRDARRELWTKALLEKVRETGNVCLDQLRWCGYPRDAKTLRGIAAGWEKRRYRAKRTLFNTATYIPLDQTEEEKAATRHVREFAAQVERELAK